MLTQSLKHSRRWGRDKLGFSFSAGPFRNKFEIELLAVVICPSGGFWVLSIDSEGIDAAKWLVENGNAAFVLEYRLVPSKINDAVKEMSRLLFGNIRDGRYE